MKKRFIFAFSFFICICSQLFAESDSVVSQKILDDLLASNNRKLQNVFQNNEVVQFGLTPNTALGKKAQNTWTSSEQPRFTSENLFFVKKATLIANSSDPDNAGTTLDAVSKVIRSISKMKGMTYYSNGAKKWETLYHESNLVKSVTDKTPIPDDTTSPIDGKVYYCYQEDNSFGGCVYSLEYSRNKDEISVCFTNVTPLKYGFITAVKPGNLKINIVIVDQGSYDLLYMLVQTVYPKISLFESRLNRSFNARVDAIYKWFTMQF